MTASQLPASAFYGEPELVRNDPIRTAGANIGESSRRDRPLKQTDHSAKGGRPRWTKAKPSQPFARAEERASDVSDCDRMREALQGPPLALGEGVVGHATSRQPFKPVGNGEVIARGCHE